MPRRTLGLLTGVLIALVVPAAAQAVQQPTATATVRVEGLTDTLVPRTSITTTQTPVVKDTNVAHACPGTSGAGALELASAGNWLGTWSNAFQYNVETVKGETRLFGSGNYWSLFINGYAAQTGICGIAIQAGDELVVAAVPEVGTTGLLKLMGVPANAKPGVAFTVTATRFVSEYDAMFNQVDTNAPEAGVTVAVGTTTATTGADGKATLTLSAGGPATVRATKTGNVRSASEPICVTDGADGFCGTVKPGDPAPANPPPPAAAAAAPVPDVAPALPSIGSLIEKAAFKSAKAPRELKGTVASDASGIRDVLLSITRRNGKTCERYDGVKTAWVQMAKCGAVNGVFFSIGNSAAWSYLLPQALTKGRYVLDVRTVDGAGNGTHGAERGAADKPRTRVVFFVT